jgi:hypothetical protein
MMRAVLRFRFRFMLMLALAPAALLLASPASAIPLLFHADLSEDQVIPPVSSPVSSFGTFNLTLSEDGTSGTFEFRLTVRSIENPLTLSHIHAGAAGANGPTEQLLFDLTGVPIEITGDYIVFSGDFQNASLGLGLMDCAAGGVGTICDYYVNVATEVFPDGELRGQLQVVPEPSTLLLLLAGISAVFAFRSRAG